MLLRHTHHCGYRQHRRARNFLGEVKYARRCIFAVVVRCLIPAAAMCYARHHPQKATRQKKKTPAYSFCSVSVATTREQQQPNLSFGSHKFVVQNPFSTFERRADVDKKALSEPRLAVDTKRVPLPPQATTAAIFVWPRDLRRGIDGYFPIPFLVIGR